MKITDVRTITVRVPVERPTAISTRQLAAREFVLVSIGTDTELTGIGYTYAGTVGGGAVRCLAHDVLRPLLLEQDPQLIERHWAAMYQQVLLSGRRGAALRAISALDVALWDLLAKSAGLPLYRLLGGWTDEVPAYASGGYYRPGDPLDNVREELSSYLALGFADFKIKVGGASFDVDVARVRAARETIGPGKRLALDANNVWRWPHEAIRFARAVEASDVWWLEEPLSPEDVAGPRGDRARARHARGHRGDPRDEVGLPGPHRAAGRRHPAAGRRRGGGRQRVDQDRRHRGLVQPSRGASLAREPPRAPRGRGPQLPRCRVLRPGTGHLQLRAAGDRRDAPAAGTRSPAASRPARPGDRL